MFKRDTYRVGAVSYLNTKPLTYALERGAMHNLIDLQFDYPSNLVKKLTADEIDIGLIPVAAIQSLKGVEIISDYCIATEGEVASVCLFSDVPLEQIKTILLDYQSRTSVALLKILLKKHWKIAPLLLESESGYESSISGNTAGLVIGDRALLQRKKSTFIYDLGIGWKELTGLPFVFAVWVANKSIAPFFLKEFNTSISQGLEKIDEIVNSIEFPEYNLNHYYSKNINYQLDSAKLNSIKLFREMLVSI